MEREGQVERRSRSEWLRQFVTLRQSPQFRACWHKLPVDQGGSGLDFCPVLLVVWPQHEDKIRQRPIVRIRVLNTSQPVDCAAFAYRIELDYHLDPVTCRRWK